MDRFTLSHLADRDLVAALKSLRAQERRTLAEIGRASCRERVSSPV